MGMLLLYVPTVWASQTGQETKIYIGGAAIDVGWVVHPLCPLDGEPFIPAAGSPYCKVKAAALAKAKSKIRLISIGHSLSAWDPSGRPLLLSQEDEDSHFLVSHNGEIIQVADPSLPGGQVSDVITINLQVVPHQTGAVNKREDEEHTAIAGVAGDSGHGAESTGSDVAASVGPLLMPAHPEGQMNSLRALLRGIVAVLPALRGVTPEYMDVVRASGAAGASGSGLTEYYQAGQDGKGALNSGDRAKAVRNPAQKKGQPKSMPKVQIVGLEKSQALSDLIQDALNPREVLP